jgi:protein-L-isoaspartate(D-aspartate) O-methyltransferase
VVRNLRELAAAGSQPGDGAEKLVLAARAAGVSDRRLLEAIRSTPRERFVPAEHAGLAYRDKPVPIAREQVTSQPSLVAKMVAALSLTGGDKVLEVGTGYGYQTALLARLAARVISIERWADLAAAARRNLAGQVIGNALVLAGDGSQGVPAYAPFDAIVVSAAFPAVPPPLVAQLAVGGRLVQPVGPGGDEDVILFRRTGTGLAQVAVLSAARFVPLHVAGFAPNGHG